MSGPCFHEGATGKNGEPRSDKQKNFLKGKKVRDLVKKQGEKK